MKLFNAFLIALSAHQVVAMNGGCPGDTDDGFRCGSCLHCHGVSDNGDGTKTVIVSGEECKNSYLSWMCCAESGCIVQGNDGSALGKDEETVFLTITNVAANATTVKVDVHDGQAYGDEDVFTESCGGNNANSANEMCSNVCSKDIDLSTCPTGPSMENDPHLKNWAGEWFDYMGECDLKLMEAPMFDGKQDVEIRARTTIRYDYSFIETAAVKIGNDVLEVSGWGDYAINGVEGAANTNMNHLPTVGGYPMDYKMVDKKRHLYNIMVSEGHNITVSSFKDWVSVKVIGGSVAQYEHVTGLMGAYGGRMLGRDGIENEDINALGQDWQVRPEEGNVFRVTREPQYPTQCKLPNMAERESRMLLESHAEEAAAMACGTYKGNAFTFCVHDVLATGDLDMAQAGAM